MATLKIKAVAKAKGGVLHALRWSSAREALCGWELHNFNKVTDLEDAKYDNGYEYVAPKNMFVTCMACVAIAGGS